MPASSEGFCEPFPSDAEYAPRCLPPCHVLPLCGQYLSRHAHVLAVDEAKLCGFVEEIVFKGQLFAELDKLQGKGSGEGSDKAAAEVGLGLCAATSPSSDAKTEEKLHQISRILAYNVMNFSFFPDAEKKPWFIFDDAANATVGEEDEAFAIVASLKRWERSGHYETWLSAQQEPAQHAGICWADARYLLSLTLDDLGILFRPAVSAGELPLLPLRLRCLHSLASGLCGLAVLAEFLEECRVESQGAKEEAEEPKRQRKAADEGAAEEEQCGEKSGPLKVGHFVSLLCKRVPAFRDLRRGSGDGGDLLVMEFAKRPQLTIGMLHGDRLVKFADMENLTVFSDYRLPQLLRSRGVLQIQDLSQLSERGELWIEAHTTLETALRAATLVVTERMRQKLNSRRGDKELVLPADLDYYLWRTTVELDGKGELLPFHKTRTFSY